MTGKVNPYEYTLQEDDACFPGSPGEPLTASEAALVKSIFGDEINTDIVKKYSFPLKKISASTGREVLAQTFGADSIKFYNAKNKPADYSQSDDPDEYGAFVHEMTHIWQNQLHGLRKVLFSAWRPAIRTYTYTLRKHSRFTHFGEEQQASIIEDYARQFLHFGRSATAEKSDKYLPSHAPTLDEGSLLSLALLQKVVEDRFPQARKARLALETKSAPAVTLQPKMM